MPDEELGDLPEPILKKIRLHREIRDIVASVTPQMEMEEKPAGHFNQADVPEHEVAEYLHRHGIHAHRYRTEH